MNYLRYLQKKFPKLYKIYCKVRYPDPWGTWVNVGVYTRIAWRRILYKLHLEGLNSEMQKICNIKETHQGERCFIVGTGASLTYKDLELIIDEYAFSSNSIFLTYSKTAWRPDCYGIVDYYGYKADMSKYSNAPLDEYAKDFVFLNSKINGKFKNDKVFSILVNNANHQKRRMKKKEFKQETEMSICFYDCFTVTNLLISLAIYMGFKKIYLLGVDCDYSGEKSILKKRWLIR